MSMFSRFQARENKRLQEEIERLQEQNLQYKMERIKFATEQESDRKHYEENIALEKSTHEADKAILGQAIRKEFIEKLHEAEDALEASRTAARDATEGLRNDLIQATQTIAVQEKELELYKAALKTNEDILEVKDIVSKLIERLPKLDISSIHVNTSDHGHTAKK